MKNARLHAFLFVAIIAILFNPFGALAASDAMLRVLKVRMSNQEGAGMDGGTFRILALAGGRFNLQLCNEGRVSSCTILVRY